jgi:hypothetical protein
MLVRKLSSKEQGSSLYTLLDLRDGNMSVRSMKSSMLLQETMAQLSELICGEIGIRLEMARSMYAMSRSGERGGIGGGGPKLSSASIVDGRL